MDEMYDTSSPMAYNQWRDKQISEFYNTGSFGKDFWRGFSQWGKLLNPNDADFGKGVYQNYVDDFYNKQSIRNAALSERMQREYEERMSSTAYQRAYDDIKKTGLNPAMLLNSAFNAASTPSSSAAFSRTSSQSSSRSESNNKSNSYSRSAVIAALIYIVAHLL